LVGGKVGDVGLEGLEEVGEDVDGLDVLVEDGGGDSLI
jgi:hypothetical protein